MEDISKQEREFLRKVYCKANYMEYEKRQQELIVENERQLRKTKIKNGIVVGLLLILAVLVSVISHFDTYVVLGSMIFLMLVSAYCEIKYVNYLK